MILLTFITFNPRFMFCTFFDAVFAQPIILGTASFVTVDMNVDLLLPNGMYTNIYLEGTYGKSWKTHAMLCPHDKYENFKDCSNRGELVPMKFIHTVMKEIKVCQTLINFVKKKKNNYTMEMIDLRDLRRKAYLAVSERAMKGKDNWRVMYYNERKVEKKREMRMYRGVLRNVTVTRRKSLMRKLPAVGFVEYANEVRLPNGQRLPPMFYYFHDKEEFQKNRKKILKDKVQKINDEKKNHDMKLLSLTEQLMEAEMLLAAEREEKKKEVEKREEEKKEETRD